MKTEALPEYNIAHHTPNANRRACHRDHRDDDADGQVEANLSQQSAEPESCVTRSPPGKDC
jgi:hypothetical protein